MNAAPFTTHTVSSKDGTTIGYRQLGQGPGIVVLHGIYVIRLLPPRASRSTLRRLHHDLPDRRGRGLSGAYQDGDGIQQEVEDLEAVLARTGAQNVFGVSVGAVIALQAALALPAISKLALYEPLLFPDAATASAMMGRYDQQMAAGKVTAALSTAMKGAQMGSAVMNAMPYWLLSALTRPMANWTPKGDYIAFADLAPALHYEGHEIVAMSGSLDAMKDVHADVLLLGGSKSSALIKDALTRVERAVPGTQRYRCPASATPHRGTSKSGATPNWWHAPCGNSSRLPLNASPRPVRSPAGHPRAGPGP